MQKLVFIVFLSVITFSCRKDENENSKNSTGIITGMDQRKCACCWGWIVEIDNNQYKFEKIPAGSSLDLSNLSYPTTVNISWRESQGNCSGRIIEVLSISQ
jgi:hypothetical protein